MAGAVRAKPGADDSPSGILKKQVRDTHDVSVPSGKGGGQKERRSKLANCSRRTVASRARIQSSTGWP
eukprot:6744024-Prymnesium_polylepis.1